MIRALHGIKRVLLSGATGICLLFGQAAHAQVTPQAGYWMNPAQAGSGFVIEVQGTQMFMAGFLYASSGEATWVSSAGSMTSTSQYAGTLITYTGGQTLNGAYTGAPQQSGSLGTITISFSSSTQGTLTWPGGTIQIQRFSFGPGGPTAQQPATNPQTGWWYNPNEGGRGFAIEVQGGTIYLAGYMYDGAGNPVWYLASGAMTNGSLFQGEWEQYGNGQTLTGSYRAPSVANSAVGAATVQFANSSNATMTLPNGLQIPLARYSFGATQPPKSYTANVAKITVDSGPTGNSSNVGYVSVTICAPGTNNCQTIDHIDVDTGSSGLRILASVLSPSLGLTQETGSSGAAIVECTQFADGYTWGPVKLVDLTIAGEQAKSLPMQVIGDPQYATVPSSCANSGPAEDTVATFGANGIIGIGVFQADCGSYCASQAVDGAYYTCTGANCQPAPVSVAMQVQNPVGYFQSDNNGVLLQLPSAPAAGAATLTGSLIFGIGTQSDNAMGNATVLNVDPGSGYLTATINGARYSDSFIDSGSSAYFLPQSFAQTCRGQQFSGYFCPSSTLGFNVIVTGVDGGSAAGTIIVANAETLFNNEPTYTAFSNVGVVNSDNTSIDLGLPFFFGRNVFSAIEGRQTPGGIGPYVAF